ncbi:preprotein translocase subunit SecA [Legionella fallonii]|uniref:Putative coiled-coil protein n=1 Tax=Legionella fallonii LLAP-10 TaxID=1212491 RepID=A0A098G6W8_9GAMM|nr:hypothetical protein [Legionella fallonii]CEG57729.1 putative coiled-coil protein [Legionella fallonii LLAP-10]
MPQLSDNKYLQSLLENLISSYETEINYAPIEIELDPQQISPNVIEGLTHFITDARKRLFIFKIPGNESSSVQLALLARKTVLDKTAETTLKNTSREPKINPLKKALDSNPSSVRTGIQIQKSLVIQKPQVEQKNTKKEHVEHIAARNINLIAIDLPELPELAKQLKVLGIEHLHDAAAQKIKKHAYAFKGGIIPKNLPKGFYINQEKHALCYTDTPSRLPSALAPALNTPEPLTLPSMEQIQELLPSTIPQEVVTLLMDTKYSPEQVTALSGVFTTHVDELKAFLQLFKASNAHPPLPQALKPEDIEFIVPFLCKQFVLGGEAHTTLLTRLLNTCVNKKISLEFLKNPSVQNTFLSTRGIKNLQKLVQLPAEQKEWWNSLVTAHLNYDNNHFDFNAFFEAYTQIFLPRIAEKNLTLPNPCPIEHNGHLLITLNRVLDVIEHATNPQEQCLSLSHLNWGAMGVHYAMTQKTEPEQLKQVSSCMHIESPEDTITNPELIYQQIEQEQLQLKPWLFRYMGQHWKAEIRLSDIQAQLFQIEQQETWTQVQRNQLTFILTCTFSDTATLTPERWKNTLSHCISLLEPLNQEERSDVLQALSRCFKFNPPPSLAQISTLIKLCTELKSTFPTKNFKTELITPLVSCIEIEGFELLNTLQERVQKTTESSEDNRAVLPIIAAFTDLLQKNRRTLPEYLVKLLAKLNEPNITQLKIDNLVSAFKNLENKKGNAFHNVALNALSQLNIAKSNPLPTIEHIQGLLEALSNLSEVIPEEHKTVEKQESWLKDLIIDKNLLPGCVLGNGDISKLDDLIVDALVDAIKKRSSAFRIDKLKKSLLENLQSSIVPQALRDQLNAELIPLFDAVHNLVELLQSPNPKFPEVIAKLHYFEQVKPILLNGNYGVGILGKSKGEYILNFLLTGEKAAADNTTGGGFAFVLKQLFGLFQSEMKSFFDDPQNKQIVKDLDLKTSLSWMKAFNDTHSLIFFFKEELIQKKVLPALRKTLQQLNTQDPEFEKSILSEAEIIIENAPSDQSLQDYKNKIEGIADYLNLLIDIKDKHPTQFNKIYKELNTGALARLNYIQKLILVNSLIQDKSDQLDLYLKLTTQALEQNPEAGSAAIERAINGLVILFNLADLEPETQIMFFKMSMAHNLKSATPFPLGALSELKKSGLPEQTKSLIIKQIIQILSRLSGADSPELVQGLVQQTQLFLIHNHKQAPLCVALLKRVSLDDPNQDLGAYPLILQQLAAISPENREKIATILTGLANNKKDDTLNLSALLEISKGLGRRSAEDIDLVLQLFETPPYPNTQSLNSALLAHDSEKLRAYCLSFDTNPFAKAGEKRDLTKQFATDRIKEALLKLEDLLHEESLPHALQMRLAKQLTFIETLGYTDPLNPNDYTTLKKLTASSRHDLQERTTHLLQQLKSKSVPAEQLETTQLELLAYLREIYFRTTGLFPNTTQMLVLLLALHDPSSNLLMRIKTGEGKSINAPMLSVLQWLQGGTVVQFTANPTLLIRDYENSCEPFFNFLGIPSALIQDNTAPEHYQLNGINCSTVEDMSFFYLKMKELKKEAVIQNGEPIHVVLDECDDGLLDQTLLYKLVAEIVSEEEEENEEIPEQWVFPLAYQFINLPAFRNKDSAQGKVWDEEEDLEQLRQFLNKEVNEKFNGDAEKQNYLLAMSNTKLKLLIDASCAAATRVENKHFLVQPIKEKDDSGNEITKKIVCVPLLRSTPKVGSIFNAAVQQALLARLMIERPEQAHYISIDKNPPELASLSALGLIKLFQNTKGRLIGISGTPGDKLELESLATALGTQAIGVAPYAGDHRKVHAPIFTFNSEESISAVHKAIENIKLPVTKPSMEIDAHRAIQTHEDREELIAQTEKAIEQWSHTQTQPVLIINEDFDASETLGKSLETYRQQGFKIQIVTGKESQEELEYIIKQAGKCNTITVGTAMLAKGIDINTGDHPKGLFVIQPYADTDRMTTQIAGRAARNGKPGEWLPIYQVKPPQNWFEKILYYIFPWYRQSYNESSVAELKSKIKLQATVDRLYTQAIDEAQQTLMQQIEAWESLLLELYPNDPKIQFELYQWRETLLNELNRSQETSISQETLATNINHFKNSACKLWELFREEKWADRAQKITQMTQEQALRFNYLKQLDLAHEFDVQSTLQKKSKPFIAGTQALMNQNLETIIRDKAGVVLDYTQPDEQMKKDLQLAQCKQLLPNLIGEFCSVYPGAITALVPKQASQGSPFLPEIINDLINRIIEHKNRLLHPEIQEEFIKSVITFYEEELIGADSDKIDQVLLKIKPLLLAHSEDLSQLPLIEQFKMQGFILTFCTLYQNSSLPEDAQLNALRASYSEEIMRRLAKHLAQEFAWVKSTPEPIHAFFERGVAKEAAYTIYDLAQEVMNTPQDKNKIQALYAGLEQQRLILRDKYLFSIGHSNPRSVINDAIAAIACLENAPHCDREFRNNCHDNIVSEHHLNEFRHYLENTSPYYFTTNDPTWDHLKTTLLAMSQQNKESQAHVLLELHETITRYSTYEAYKPYLSQLNSLNSQIMYSIEELKKSDGLQQDAQECLLAQKASEFARLLQVDPNQIRIQSGTDGIQSYIELQIENAPSKEGFTGYQSPFFTKIEGERAHLQERKSMFEENSKALRELSNAKAGESLSAEKRPEFEKLLRLKALLQQNWNNDLDILVLTELPEVIQSKLQKADVLKQCDWTKQPVNLEGLNNSLGKEPGADFTALLEEQVKITKQLEETRQKMDDAEQQLATQQATIQVEENAIKALQARQQELNWYSALEHASIASQILYHKGRLLYLQNQLKTPTRTLAGIKDEETQCQQKLDTHNQQIDSCRIQFVADLKAEAKQDLALYLENRGQQQVDEVQKDLQKTEDTISKIQEAELKKSRYQTRRFFKSSELLRYEASLSHEEARIPSKPAPQSAASKVVNEQEVEDANRFVF